MPSLTPRVGDRVRHATLGEGVVLTAERGILVGRSGNLGELLRYTVRFALGINVVSARLLTVINRPSTTEEKD